EGGGVFLCLLGTAVLLHSAGSVAAATVPHHRGSLGTEPVAMTEYPASQHTVRLRAERLGTPPDMSTQVETRTISTRIPARLDRLPWTKFHWRVLVGLGTVWILDGLEVTMVGNVAARMTANGSGIDIGAGQIGLAGSIYVIGACLGALFFGQLTDRLGRKKLFIATLAIYIVAQVATAFAFAPWFFYLVRFLTGSGFGGEDDAINSAID